MNKDFEFGDKVKIKTVKEELEGIILEAGEPGLYLLKLKSGYNIGVEKEDIVSVEVVQKRKGTKEAKIIKEIKMDKNKKNIDMIVTGGTISARLDYETGGVSWLTSPEMLLEFYPELKEIVNIRKVKMPFMKASENMDYLDWKAIAKEAYESLKEENCDGVIITHGTDFLHYTAAALSFFLRDLNKPVVLTYAQRSSDRASSDARLNLVCSAYAAASDIAEVMLVGHASSNDDFCYALKGSKVRKMHTSRRDAFKPVNTKEIAKIFPDGRIEKIISHSIRDDKRKVKLDDSYDDSVVLLMFHPGMDPEIFDYYAGRYKGMILLPGALGHLPIEGARKNLLPSIKKAIDNGLVICAAPQTIYGRLDPLVYSPGRLLLKTGIIFLEDMLPEVALVKLGWVLGHKDWRSKIKEKMLENMAGELNKRLEE